MRRVLAAALLALGLLMSGCATAPTVDPQPDVVDSFSIIGDIDNRAVDYVTGEVTRINGDDHIKAVVIDVNSGGGGVTASAEIAEELAKLRVPAVAWCDGVCASGAMWMLMTPSVKAIYGRAGVICGSIGVISRIAREDAPDNLETYRSGKLKQASSHPGAPTEDEKAYLQQQVDEMAARFYEVVKTARGDKISDPAWEEIKTARVFFDERCVEVGLLDAIGPHEAAVEKARSLAH